MTFEACAALVERGDPDRFLVAMSAPVAARAKLFPFYAFNLEAARAPWLTEEPMIAEMRLQWWRDVVEELAAGKPAKAHEVVGPLAGVMQADDAPAMDALIAARRWDIYKDAFEDAAHFQAYLEDTSGGLMWLTAKALGAANEQGCRDVGYAAGMAAWFQAVPELEARGRIPLVDGRPEAVQALAQSALDRFVRFKAGPATPALRAAWLAEPILRQAVADPRRVADGTLGVSEFQRRASLIWKTTLGRW